MRTLLALGLALLASCGGSGGGDVALSVTGVTMADLAAIQADLGRLKGVSDVRPGAFKDGRAEFKVRFAGDGAALAADLARLGSGLKNVTGFDAAGVQVAWDGKAPPAPVVVEPPKPAPPPAAPAAVAPPPPVPATAPAPTPPVPAAVAPKPAAGPTEVKVDVQKDPLAYKVHQLEAGTIATFDGWKITHVPNNDLLILETHPEGKENDFQMIVLVGVQNAAEQAKLFEEGPAKLKQLFPALREGEAAKKAVFGGDEGRVQDWTIDINGRGMLVQTVLIRKKDVAVALLAVGTAETFKTYGRAVAITAQSITVKESPPDPGLVGTWHLEKYYSSGAGTSNAFSHSSSTSITIYQNGTFTERSMSSSNLNNNTGTTSAYLDGGDRGKVLRRGTLLTFHYDNGKTWNTEYKFDGGALRLGGNLWMKQ